jgi:hypothetical protein
MSSGSPIGTQLPLLSQASAPLHKSRSLQEVPAGRGVCETPVLGSQASTVHALLSFTVGAEPAAHVPATSQTSSPLHRLSSGQAVPVGANV